MIDIRTHDGRNGKAVLLSVLEETEDIVTDNDAGLAAKLLKDTHYEVCTKSLVCRNLKGKKKKKVRSNGKVVKCSETKLLTGS